MAKSTCIIFTRTCDNARKIALSLRNLGFGAIPIHGQMSQPKRLGALNKFKVCCLFRSDQVLDNVSQADRLGHSFAEPSCRINLLQGMLNRAGAQVSTMSGRQRIGCISNICNVLCRRESATCW